MSCGQCGHCAVTQGWQYKYRLRWALVSNHEAAARHQNVPNDISWSPYHHRIQRTSSGQVSGHWRHLAGRRQPVPVGRGAGPPRQWGHALSPQYRLDDWKYLYLKKYCERIRKMFAFTYLRHRGFSSGQGRDSPDVPPRPCHQSPWTPETQRVNNNTQESF